MQEFVKKLIERLEEEIFTCQSAYAESVIGMCGKSAENYISEMHAFEKTKKIVNQLAEEYNNDFCEWKQEDEEGFSNCRFNYQEIISDEVSGFVYCPYCGKKIKIAPYQLKGAICGKEKCHTVTTE